jgi:hypothetical protein
LAKRTNLAVLHNYCAAAGIWLSKAHRSGEPAADTIEINREIERKQYFDTG